MLNRKAVLVIVRDFPPYFSSLGGVIRILKMCDFLRNSEIAVHVVAAAGLEISYFGYEDLVKRITIHYVPDVLQRYNNQRSTTFASTAEDAGVTRKIVQKIRNMILELSVPDLGIFFFRGLYKKSIQVIESHHIENVIVSSPPFSTQAIGWLLKRRMGERINLIVDYRDSWNTLSIFAKRWRTTRAFNRIMERHVLKAADHLLYQSPPVICKIDKMFPGIVRNSQLVMNGYDPSMELAASGPAPANEMLTIGHFGAISDDPKSFRNPTPLLQAVVELDLPIRFEFYGAARLSSHWQHSLVNRFFLGGNLSHETALRQMAKCDVLMLIHSDPIGADEVIPAKIFEYMLAGRPILAAGPEGMESRRMVREKHLGYSINILDRSDIKVVLKKILMHWRQGHLVQYDRGALTEFSRPLQYAKILPLLR